MSKTILIAAQLITLHSVDGREIDINAEQITRLTASLPSGNTLLPGEVNCLVNTTDGKNVSVIETCEYIRRRMIDVRGGYK